MLDRDYAIGTNEAFHIFTQFIPKERLLAIDLIERFPAIPDDVDIVFDLAGTISAASHSITSAITQSDLVIVPIHNEVKALNSGLGTLEQIRKLDGFNGSVLIVATKLLPQSKRLSTDSWRQCGDFTNIEHQVEEAGFDYPILPLRFSKVFDAIFEKEKSINQIRKESPLQNFTYRDVDAQFDAIYKHIDEVCHAGKKQRRSA